MAKHIDDRMQELTVPYHSIDQNVGGGKSSKISRPQETISITIDEDRRLRAMESEKKAIEATVLESDADTITMITEVYFKEHPEFTIDGLIINHKINCSRNPAYQKKADFFVRLAKRLNMYDPY